MSATIPENMLLSDLLKATGYDCPDDLQGKTFEESTSGGGEADLEANHASSVNVEEYTQPIEITPAEGKDGMEKVTLTLTNIPEEKEEQTKSITITENGTTTVEPDEGKVLSKVTVTTFVTSSELRYFDGRNTDYSSNPRGFWVIGKNQTSGKACCLVLSISLDTVPNQSYCIQTIQSLTDNRLMIDEAGRESFPEVTADVVAQAIANLS